MIKDCFDLVRKRAQNFNYILIIFIINKITTEKLWNKVWPCFNNVV